MVDGNKNVEPAEEEVKVAKARGLTRLPCSWLVLGMSSNDSPALPGSNALLVPLP